MKLRIALAAAALAAAGTCATIALAQEGGTPPERPFDSRPIESPAHPDLLNASRRVHDACAVDMHVKCAGKTGEAADRCLVYHRLSFSSACRSAITGFERAAAPLDPGQSVAPFRPYSRFQTTRAEPSSSGWLTDPAARTATGS